MSKKIITPVLLILLVMQIFLNSLYARNKLVFFFTDTARDFLLMEEISTKKVMLIGARSSLPGLFHGPLWNYLNYPVYQLSHQNPYAQSWFWFALIATSIIVTTFVITKLFNLNTGLLSGIFVGSTSIDQAKGLTNPFGAQMLLPVFFYFLVRYQQTKKPKFLAIASIVCGLMMHFQIAFAGPIFAAMILILIFYIKPHIRHYLSLLSVIIPLATYILFDLTHNFFQVRSILSFMQNKQVGITYTPYISRIANRIHLFSENGIGIFTDKITPVNILVFIIFIVFLTNLKKFQKSKHRPAVYIAAMLYSLYFLISLVFNGDLLEHQWYLVQFFSLVILSSTFFTKLKKITLPIMILAIILNTQMSLANFKLNLSLKGQHEDDWTFMDNLQSEIFEKNDELEFGYFVFAPDIYAYEGKAAMSIGELNHPDTKAHRLQKKPVTYLIIAPPPPKEPYYNHIHWKSGLVKIDRPADEVVNLPGDYMIEKFYLSPEELDITPSQDLDWLTFR